MVYVSSKGSEQSKNVVAPAPKLDDDVRELASEKLSAVKDFYEARAKMARLNSELFDKGFVLNHELMSW
jgi:hypothetical protein